MKFKKEKSAITSFSERKAVNPFIDEEKPKILLPVIGSLGPGGINPEFKPRSDLKWDLHKDGITFSLLSTFLQCPEKLLNQYGQRLSGTRVSGALAFGSVFHEALDHIYSYKKTSGNFPAVSDVLFSMETRDKKKLIDQMVNPVALMDLEENYGLAEIVLEGYMDYWQKEHSSLEWVALEEKFCVQFRPSIQLGLALPDIPVRGKRDGVFRSGNSLWLFETKTKARIEDESILDTLAFNMQNNIYMWSGQIDYGEKFGGVLYNLVRRPQLKQGARENLRDFLSRVRDDIKKRPDFYFVRYNLASSSGEKEKWMRYFKGVMWKLIMWYYNQYHYRDDSACSGRKGICEFLPICSERPGASGFYAERESVFPELEEVE